VGLLGATAWLITTPVFAGGASARCLNNTTIQCLGNECTSRDESATASGYCQCSLPMGGVDYKSCTGGGNY
jgi:hypothetical protein